MEENEKVETSVVEEPKETSENYINTIAEMKRNSVPLEKYNQVVAENGKLLNQLANGENIEKELPEEVVSSDELRNKLFNSEDLSNLEYCENALKLRENILKEKGIDIFVANNQVYTADSNDYAEAEKVADVLKECIEYAKGDSEAFTNELMRRTNDVALPKRMGR